MPLFLLVKKLEKRHSFSRNCGVFYARRHTHDTTQTLLNIHFVFSFNRPTHLLESHVSGVLLKKEITDEGEVRSMIMVLLILG